PETPSAERSSRIPQLLFPRIRRKTFTREAFSWERPISPAGGRTPGLEKSLAIDEATKRLIDALMEPIVAVDSTGGPRVIRPTQGWHDVPSRGWARPHRRGFRIVCAGNHS